MESAFYLEKISEFNYITLSQKGADMKQFSTNKVKKDKINSETISMVTPQTLDKIVEIHIENKNNKMGSPGSSHFLPSYIR